MHPERLRRSLSPRDRVPDLGKHRSRSPRRRAERSIVLPFGQRLLDKHDLKEYRPLFADYLQVQKGLELEALPDSEVKGRWKSFLGKWNRGELAEGWYDPAVLERAKGRAGSEVERLSEVKAERARLVETAPALDDDDDDDDDVGPALPPSYTAGPAIPSLQDLQYRQELAADDQAGRRTQAQHDRQAERRLNKDRLDELAPRADPGSRERQLEKKRDVASTNRAFSDAKDSGAVEIADSDLMGEDSLSNYKAKIKVQERTKNEREIRREEVLRARAAEREERLAEHRRKEDKTMAGLRALAQQRFGAGNAT